MDKVRKPPNMHGKPKQHKNVTIHVTDEDIKNAKCMNPNQCMIKVATKRALNLAHGYIHVDATGVSISRNGKYREKAFMPHPVVQKMIGFDMMAHGGPEVKPFTFKLSFYKTTPVGKIDARQRSEYTRRAKKTGNARKKYDMRSRIVGLSISGSGDEKKKDSK